MSLRMVSKAEWSGAKVPSFRVTAASWPGSGDGETGHHQGQRD